MNDECPCRYCVPPKRTVTCHIDCPEHKEWHDKHEEKNALINARKNEESEMCGYISRQMYKHQKMKGKQR